MKWVKASERLWKYGTPTIVKYDGDVSIHLYHNITYCVSMDKIEWLDESPDPASPSLLEAHDIIHNLLEAIPKQTEDADWWESDLVDAVDNAKVFLDALALHSSGREGEGQEDTDNFAIAFHIWATHDPQAKAYQEAGISAGNLLRKYKDRPYINMDTSNQ